MQEQMQLLKELQGLDLELNKVRQSRQELVTEQAALSGDLERIQAMVDSLMAESETFRDQRQDLYQALTLEQENVKKAEGRLPDIKTQKEYVAVLKEIDTAKKMNRDIEEKIQAKDSEIAAIDQERQEKEGELAAVQEKVGARQAEIGAAIDACDRALAEHSGQRDAHLAKLPVPVRKRYQLLCERRGGVAVVEARNGACLGCNMHLPPQLFNSLFRLEEIQSCPHCNRLLFVAGGE